MNVPHSSACQCTQCELSFHNSVTKQLGEVTPKAVSFPPIDIPRLFKLLHAELGQSARYRNQPLWVLVALFGSQGESDAKQTCKVLGWDPEALSRQQLPNPRIDLWT